MTVRTEAEEWAEERARIARRYSADRLSILRWFARMKALGTDVTIKVSRMERRAA